MRRKNNLLMLTKRELGLKLKLLLEAKGVSRAELAGKLNKILMEERVVSRFSEQIIQSYEAGRREFSFIFVKHLCEVLNTDIRFFGKSLNEITDMISEDKSDLSAFDLKNIAVVSARMRKLTKVIEAVSNPGVADAIIKLAETSKGR
jgi:transcriptional regulator with XRE-family HTH domain